MSEEKRARLKEWMASGEVEVHPLTFPQRELWEASPVSAGDPAHHICCLIEVRGLLTERDCRAAIQQVVNRQNALRISILSGKEKPLQMIRRTREANFQVRDLSETEKSPEAVEGLAAEIFRTPFDLTSGPLYRAVDLRRAPDDHVIVFVIHHAIADGWTLGVFVTELFAAYFQSMVGSSEELPAVPLTYPAWGVTERAFWTPAVLAKRADFWKEHLAGATRLWPETAISGDIHRQTSNLPLDLADQLRAAAKQQGVTLFSLLLALFQVAFWRWTGARNFVVGSPVANRGRKTVHGTMGYCSTVVPLHGAIDPSLSITAHVAAVNEQTQLNFANAMPFVELVKMMGENVGEGLNPLFDIRFALQNHPVPEVSLPTLSARLRMRSTGTPRFKLGCEITEVRDGLEVVWLYRKNLFSSAETGALDQLFRSVLREALTGPDRAIGTLTL